MKVLGGIKGIGNNQSALDRHFLISSEMNLIIDNFYSMFNVKSSINNCIVHYQLMGSTNFRHSAKTIKIHDKVVSLKGRNQSHD